MRIRVVAGIGILLILAISSTSFADDEVPESIKAMAEKVKEHRDSLQQQAKKAKYAERAKVREELNRINSGNIELTDVCRPLDLISLKAGMFGTVAETALEVESVVNRDTVIVLIRTPVRRTSGGQTVGIGQLNQRIQSGIDRGKSQQFTYGNALIVRGVSTKELADGSTLAYGVYEVTGTDSYETVLGDKKTCFVLRPLDTEKWMPKIKELAGLKK